MTDPIVLQATGDVKGPASSTDNSMVLFSGTSGKVIKGNNAVVTAAGLALLDDNNNTEQRNTLGLGTIATQNSNAVTISGGTITGITDLTIADGGTGASTAAQARANLGIVFGLTAGTYGEGSVLALKPDKSYVDSQDALKANLASPTFTGVPSVPTAPANTNTTQAASTAFARTEAINAATFYNIGWNQTWQAVSRGFGVAYINDTGRPIVLAGSYTGGGGGGGYTGVAVVINGVTVPIASDANSSSGGGKHLCGNILIPAGATYTVINNGSTSGITGASHWELR